MEEVCGNHICIPHLLKPSLIEHIWPKFEIYFSRCSFVNLKLILDFKSENRIAEAEPKPL